MRNKGMLERRCPTAGKDSRRLASRCLAGASGQLCVGLGVATVHS